jgi:predicted MFS family arabinose efflux permease
MSDPDTAAVRMSPDRYRYVVVLIGFATLGAASGITNAFSVFYSTLLDVFNWSHAAGASVYSVNMLVVALSSPVMGWLLDRFGPRWLFASAAVLIGIAFLACSRLTSLGQYLLYYGVLSAMGQTALLSMTVVVARWFAASHRGRAIGFADVGTGFGTVVMVPGSAWLIAHLGWRQAFVVLGAAMLLVLLPLNLLHRPTPTATQPNPLTASLSGLLRHRALWWVCIAHLFMTITMTMVNVHLVEFLVQTRALQLLAASTVLSAVSLVSLPGRLFFGWLADRLQAEGAFTIAMSCTMTGFGLLLLFGQFHMWWLLYAFVIVYGFAQGAGGIAVAAKTVALFQGPFLGTIFMVVTLSGNLGAAFGAWFGGRLFDLSGGYASTFFTAIVSGIVAIICMWTGDRSSVEPRAHAERSSAA